MIKKYKSMIIVSCIVTLLPILFGILNWNQLPKKMATHFNFSNEANGWSGRTFAVFGIPLFLLVTHLICVFATTLDPKHQHISSKMYRLIIWICPVCSIICAAAIYGYALESPISVWLNSGLFVNLMMGLIFIIMGNYLPKCRQNFTVGIKIPWTLSDADNWNRTHRLAGRLYMVIGILFILNALLHWNWMLAVCLVAAISIPAIYSLVLYLKGNNK